jgi:hypothetical protein
MQNRRILFLGDSTIRQQVQALVWTLGHDKVEWDKIPRFKLVKSNSTCPAIRECMIDDTSNTTICRQFMGSMATKIYQQDNFTLDHSLRGDGDTSCLLDDEMIYILGGFDLVFVQGVVWFANLPLQLKSQSSPKEWVQSMVPVLYRDAMEGLLTKLSKRTKTVITLGQVGSDCINKTVPDPAFSSLNIPNLYGWKLGPVLWNATLDIIKRSPRMFR